MDNETFRILARHFGDAEHIAVEFKPGACPATNGKQIILPDDLQAGGDIMLSALLHECGHVARTDFRITPDSLNPPELFVAVNALEDIRIDAATAAKYPTARQFNRVSLQDVLARNGDALKAEPPAIQILKGLIMTAGGNADVLPSLYSPEQCANIERLAAKYIPDATAAQTTHNIVPLAERLALDIALCTPQTGASKAQQEAAKAAREAADKAEAEQAALRDKYNQEQKREREAHTKYKHARTQRRANQTKASRAEWNARKADQAGDQKAADKARAEQAKAAQRAKEYDATERAEADKTNASRNKLRVMCEEYNRKQQAAFEARSKANAESAQNAQAIGEQFASGQGVSLSGFGSLDVQALRAASSITIKQNLAETIKAALIARREQAQLDESGNAINARALPDYQTADPETFFIEQEQRDYKTRVAFLIDVSGSMGNLNDNDERDGKASGLTLATDALASLLDATKKAIHEGAPAELVVYAFGDRKQALKIIDGVDAYTKRDDLGRALMQARGTVGQGTEIVPAVNRVAEDMKEFPDHEHITIILTDADFGASDAREIRNQASTDSRTVFLGIDAKLDGYGDDVKIRREIFGKYNITSAETAPGILRRAFMDAIK